MKRITIFLSTAAFLASTSASPAADPAWWAARGVTTGAPQSNLSPATIGQAKHMAAMALAELQPILDAQAFQALQADVAGIVNLAVPMTPTDKENQLAILLVGQLKAAAKPFYDRLRTLDAPWLDNEMISADIRVVEPGSNPITYSTYPWSVTASDDNNKAVATVGQLKAVFSMRLESIDSDHDGLLDKWERSHFPDLAQTATGDPDGDGLTNAQELSLGFDPGNSDSDGDGLADGEEDADGDGIRDQDEIFVHHTNPKSLDSDGDGVSDWDEIMVNFTNPISATDADGDGIPDDFEKHLAKQLLEFQPDPAYWNGAAPEQATAMLARSMSSTQSTSTDSIYDGLVKGDVDPDHDYTGDGLSAKELSSLFSQSMLGSGNPQAEYLIQPQYRFNKLANAYYYYPTGTSPGEAHGQYIEGGLAGTYDITQITELTNLMDFSPAYLENHIAGVSWLPLVSNDFADPFYLSHYSHSVAGFQTTEGSPTLYGGFNKQGRLRFVATRLNHEPFTRQFTKLTSRREYRLAGLDFGESVSVEPLTITIPKGRFLTDWINFEPPVIEGRATVVSLQSVDLMDVKDHENSEDDVVIANWTSGQTIADANIAWIEAHKSATDVAPRMPQLVFHVPALPQYVTLEAKLLVEYERPYAGKQTYDTVEIPADGSFRSVTDGIWEIWNEYNNIPFFGGDGTLTYKINGGAEKTIKFAIGGRNPDEARCKKYTQGLPGAPWYSYAIEKHESQSYNPGYYNQFWERNGNSSAINRGVNYSFTRGDALVVRSSGETGVGGAGLAQVTGVGGNKTVSAPREVFWNWQENVEAFMDELRRNTPVAETFMNDQTPRNGPNSMPNGQRPQTTFHTGHNVPVPSRVQGRVTFGDEQGEKRPEDAVAIKIYNGAQPHWCSWSESSPHVWQFNDGQYNYVEEVCNEVEGAQP